MFHVCHACNACHDFYIDEMKRIPGILRVEVYDCRAMSSARVDLMQRLGINFDFEVDSDDMDISEPAELEIQTEDGISKVVLKFSSQKKINSGFTPGFVVKDAMGYRYAIGWNDYPYPVVKMTEYFGQAAGDAAEYRYEVSHIALETPLRLGKD